MSFSDFLDETKLNIAGKYRADVTDPETSLIVQFYELNATVEISKQYLKSIFDKLLYINLPYDEGMSLLNKEVYDIIEYTLGKLIYK